MGAGVLLTIGSLLYIIVIGIVYFKKKKINSLENKVFSKIIIANIIGLILHLSLFCLMSFIGTESIYTIIVSKLYLIYLISYMILFTAYVFIISSRDRLSVEENYKKIMLISFIIIGIISVLIFFLPIEFHNEVGKMYSFGKAVTVVYIMGFSVIFLNVIFLLSNIKQALDKKYYPLFLYFLLGLVTTIVQFKYPYIQLMTAKDTFILLLIYFTIENPDIKMIKELTYSKKLAEKSQENTLNILNDMHDDLKNPLEKLITIGYKEIDKNNLEEVNKEIKAFQKFSINLADKITGNLDLARLDSGSNEVQNNKYDTYEMLNDIKYLINYKKGNNKISITTNIAPNINKVLYGDSDKCKQIVLYMVGYIINIVKTGNININISSMEVGRFCKLKFSLMIDNPKIKENIYYDSSLIKYELGKSDLNYEIIKRLVELLYGQIDIRDNESSSTEIVLSVNQRIIPEYDIDELVVTDDNVKIRYFDLSDKRIVIIDDSKPKIKELVRMLKPYKVHIDIATSKEQLFDIVDSNKVFDLILIDDIIPEPINNTDESEYQYDSNYLQSIKKYTKSLLKRARYEVPLIIMVTPNNKQYEKKYLNSGFNGYIIKPVKKSDLYILLKKYFKEQK